MDAGENKINLSLLLNSFVQIFHFCKYIKRIRFLVSLYLNRMLTHGIRVNTAHGYNKINKNK